MLFNLIYDIKINIYLQICSHPIKDNITLANWQGTSNISRHNNIEKYFLKAQLN